MATISYAHIEHDADGRPVISGTQIKVRMIALDHVAHGRDAEEIQRHHPGLTLGQVHSALAYYHDHKDAIDRDLRERMSGPANSGGPRRSRRGGGNSANGA